MPGSQPDLFAQLETTGTKRQIYTVSQVVQDIKLVLESSFPEVWVEGEISNFGSKDGHFYFVLKDAQGILPAVMFSRANKDVKFKLENGQKVLCFGKVSAYAPYGKYQIIVEKVEPKGIGSLQLALEQLKARLEKEGLFAPEHKRPLPYLPAKIAVVTSASGAAIKDILKVLDRRFSDVSIVIRPAQVQGEAAKDDIAEAIKELNEYNEKLSKAEKIEVMIVGRGGGSIEDLWAFNEEIVAKAIYASKIPVISAVGHERDVSISDLVADVRAATPSVAAELVLPQKEELRGRIDELREMLWGAFGDIVSNSAEGLNNLMRHLRANAERALERGEHKMNTLKHRLIAANPSSRIEQHKTRLMDLARQIFVRTEHFLKLRQASFNTCAEKLSSLSPLNILSRGYSITFRIADAAVVKEAGILKPGDPIKTRLHKGEIVSKVTEVIENGGS
jgi:exodeoxyribonuclease VII large subunit